MLPKVVVTNWIHPEVVELLQAQGTVIVNPTRQPWSREQVIEQARDAVGLMAFMPDRVDAVFLEQCPALRVVACALKGFDNFDVDACTRRGVWLTVVPDLLTVPAAELAIGLLIGLARHVMPGDEHVRSGEFRGWRPLLYGTGLAGSTVGFLGMGSIGKAIAERLRGFGCAALIYHDAHPLGSADERALGLRSVSFARLLADSDFLIIAVPFTDETKHKVDADALQTMKSDAYLLNIARGSVVDEDAVGEALVAGRLGGYTADVFEMEDWARPGRPTAVSSKLLALRDRTLFTPHLGSAVESVRLEIELAAARSILQVLRGECPDGAVNRPASAMGRDLSL